MSDFKTFPSKDPTAKLDYLFDWAPKTNNRDVSDWLREGETIISYIVTVPVGLTIVTDGLVDTNTAVLVWLSGGVILTDYKVSCKITTSMGREDTRSAIVPVRSR